MPTMRREIHERMTTTAELQARKEALLESERKTTSFLNCCVPASEAIELIEEILRLREEVANQEPVKWITGKPYRNE